MSGNKLKLLLFIDFLFLFELFSIVQCYDEWNNIPCAKEHQPANCDFENLDPVTVDDFDRCAPARLPLNVRNYYLGAAGRRDTYKENKDAFRRIKIIPKGLRDISRYETNIKVLGMDVDFPLGFSPVAAQKLAHSDGELATVLGLSGMKTIMILSSYATTKIEDVAKRAEHMSVHLWMQTYIFKNRSLTVEIVQKAERHGFKGIVLTADGNIDATLTCNARNKVKIPHKGLANLGETYLNIMSEKTTFWDIRWLKSITSLPIIVKGILSGADATLAIMAGASAILVSNHGGRQLDGGMAAIDALPGVVDAVNRLFPRREVYMDGGVRNGYDIYKALARGAKMAFVGRPIIWALALNGSEGVNQMMTILKKEFTEAMRLSGNTKPSDIKTNSLIPHIPIINDFTSDSLEEMEIDDGFK